MRHIVFDRLSRMAGWLRRRPRKPPSGPPPDPFSWRPVALKHGPKSGGQAVAVAEPDDDRFGGEHP